MRSGPSAAANPYLRQEHISCKSLVQSNPCLGFVSPNQTSLYGSYPLTNPVSDYSGGRRIPERGRDIYINGFLLSLHHTCQQQKNGLCIYDISHSAQVV